MPRAASARGGRLGRLRARGRAAPHREPRAVQVAALPRRGLIRESGRVARARPPRRAGAADALDGRRLPGRGRRDRRAAAAQRVRVGVGRRCSRSFALPVYGGVADGTAGAIALAALAATAALAALCFVKVVGLVLLGPARRDSVANARGGARRDARRCRGSCGRVRAARRSPGTALRVAGRARAVGRGRPVHGRPRPARDGVAAHGWDRARPGRPRGRLGRPPWPASGGARADLGVRAARGAPARLDERGIHQAAAAGPRGRAATRARDRGANRGRHRPGGRLRGTGPAPVRGAALSAADRRSRCSGAHQARRLQSGRLGTYVGYLVGLVLVVLGAAKLGVIG